MTRKRLAAVTAGAALACAVVVGPVSAASTASCAGQFAMTGAHVARPFGQSIVVPEVRTLTLGGPNLGQEVQALLARADRTACPVVVGP
jgi:hypothetical protein